MRLHFFNSAVIANSKMDYYHWGTSSNFIALIFFGISEASVAVFQTKRQAEKSDLRSTWDSKFLTADKIGVTT